jgi:hypothetical protein
MRFPKASSSEGINMPSHASSDEFAKSMIVNKSLCTRPEALLSRMLWEAGYRGYRKNEKSVPEKPTFNLRAFG